MKYKTNLVSQIKTIAFFSLLAVALLSVNVAAAPSKDFNAGSTTVTLSQQLVAAATSLNLSVSPISPAFGGGATFSFPIIAGTVDLANAKGEIIHGGGLRLSAGGTRVDLKNFIIDTTGAQPVLTGVAVVNNSVVGRIPLFKLTLPALSLPLPSRTSFLFIPNVNLRLTAQAAAALNQSFGVTAFTENFPVGTAQVQAVSFGFFDFPFFNRDGSEVVPGATPESKENLDQK